MDAVCSAQASKAEHDDTMAELQACATTGPAGSQGDGGRERGDQAEDSGVVKEASVCGEH
jgi:hypothetical protein